MEPAILLSSYHERSERTTEPISRRERASHVAQLITAIATLIAVLWATFTCYQTTQAQNEAQATAALQEYFKLAAENPSAAPFERSERVYRETERDAEHPDLVLTDKYEWGAKHAMLAADSAYQLAAQGSQPWWFAMIPSGEVGILADEEWKATIRSLAGFHDTYLLSIQFPCEHHSAEFKDFLRQRPPYENLCPSEDKVDQLAKEKLQEAVATQKRFYLKYDSYTQHEWKLEKEGFQQGDGSEDNPRVMVDYGDKSTFCMDAPGGTHESWEITPMVSEPRPGDCIGY